MNLQQQKHLNELSDVSVESYYEGDMTPSEVEKLQEKYPVLKKHFSCYQHLDVFRRNGEVVALRIEKCILYTHKGIFMRSYANTLLHIAIQGWDDKYLYIQVDNRLNKTKRLDISLPIRDESLVKI